MKVNRPIKTIEQNGMYDIRFMPPIDTGSQFIGTLEMYDIRFMPPIDTGSQFIGTLEMYDTEYDRFSRRFYSYHMNNGEVAILAYGNKIRQALEHCTKGYWGDPEGYIIEDADNM